LGVEAIDKLDERFSKAMVVVARSGISVRQRRMNDRRQGTGRKSVTISPELTQSRNRVHLRSIFSKDLLTHKQVI
jgi:RNA polymerase primary sigma factor